MELRAESVEIFNPFLSELSTVLQILVIYAQALTDHSLYKHIRQEASLKFKKF